MTSSPDANHAQVQRIIASTVFRTSEIHRKLLTYLAEQSLAGQAQTLKEYTVGLDVFGKPDSYDPREESVVRMHVGRLRQKLIEYYRTEGADDPIIIDLPKGGILADLFGAVDTSGHHRDHRVFVVKTVARSVAARGHPSVLRYDF